MKPKNAETNETESSGYARESRPEKVVARLRPHARVLVWPTLLLFALAGGTDLVGTATGIDAQGRLTVVNQADGEKRSVAAGDVTHLRY